MGRMGSRSDALGRGPTDEAMEATYLGIQQEVPAMACFMAAGDQPRACRFFYSMETTGYPIRNPVTTVFIAIGLNLIVLFWLLLLIKGRDLADPAPVPCACAALSSPSLMTIAVFYLFVVYHPQGPYITDVFARQVGVLEGSNCGNHGLSFNIPGR